MPERPLSPEIPIAMELSAPLAAALAQAALDGPVTAAIARVLEPWLAETGIPGRPVVRLKATPHAGILAGLRVNGRRCRPPAELNSRLRAFCLRQLPEAPEDATRFGPWLFDLVKAAAAPESPEHRQLLDFLARAALEMLKLRPSLALDTAQTDAYRQLLLAHWTDPPATASLRPLLAEALDLGLSLADASKVAAALRTGNGERRGADEAMEDLIAALQAPEIEIRLAPGYLRTLTETGAPAGQDKPFSLMRDGLFYELGILFPEFRFMTDDQLPPGSFAFRLNHHTSMPCIGLSPGQVLANDEPGRLRLLNLEPLAATRHPVNQRSVAVIAAKDAARAARAGIITWDPLGYLILCLSVELRRRAAGLLRQETLRTAFEQLAAAQPVLIATARERLPLSRLARVLRELLAEEVSVRDFRLVLEAILRCDCVVADEAKTILFDERIACRTAPPPHWRDDPTVLATAVRRALKRYLSHKYTRGQSTLPVYLLDPAIETRLAAHASGEAPLSEPERDEMLAAVESEIGWLPPSASTPAVLTSTEARRPFAQLVRTTYPSLPVVAYQELSPEMNIQPLARIAFPDPRPPRVGS